MTKWLIISDAVYAFLLKIVLLSPTDLINVLPRNDYDIVQRK